MLNFSDSNANETYKDKSQGENFACMHAKMETLSIFCTDHFPKCNTQSMSNQLERPTHLIENNVSLGKLAKETVKV